VRALVATFVILALLVIGLQFDSFGTRVARAAVRAFVPSSALHVSIDRVSGSWIRSLHVEGLRLTNLSGEAVVSIDTLHISYRLLPLLRRRFAVEAIRVVAPVVHAKGWPSYRAVVTCQAIIRAK
jgi:hypothetical protein